MQSKGPQLKGGRKINMKICIHLKETIRNIFLMRSTIYHGHLSESIGWLHHKSADESHFISLRDLHTLYFGSTSYSLITGNKHN